jgi:hypothetical protein
MFDPCCDGHYCSFREGFECVPKRQPGEACGPDAHCLEGFTCMPSLTPTCVIASIDTAADQACRALQVPIIGDMARESRGALTFSVGESATALVGVSIEMGVAYGADGEFGCFATVCGGVTSDVSVSLFATMARYNSYADIQGLSVLASIGASTLGIEVGGTAGTIYAIREPSSITDFASKTLIGSSGTVSVGLGLAPAQFTTNVCYTEILGGTDSVKGLDDIVQRGEDAIEKLRAEMGESVIDPRTVPVTPSIDPFSEECQRLSDERAMITRNSFGFATADDVARWRSLQCQTTPSPEATPIVCQTMSDEFRISPTNPGRATGAVQASFEALQCSTIPGDGNLSCQELSDRYAILSGSGFGFATPDARERWRAQGCKTRPTHDAIPGLCQTMSDEFGISQMSYGTSTPSVRKSFFQMECRTTPTTPQPGSTGCSGRGCASGASGSSSASLIVIGGLLLRRRRRRSELR